MVKKRCQLLLVADPLLFSVDGCSKTFIGEEQIAYWAICGALAGTGSKNRRKSAAITIADSTPGIKPNNGTAIAVRRSP